MIKGIGERIKQLRIEHDLTMDMLAADLNQRYQNEKPINISMISRWENDINNPTLDNAKNLCDYFNVSLDYIIGLTETRTPAHLLAYAKRFAEIKKGEKL